MIEYRRGGGHRSDPCNSLSIFCAALRSFGYRHGTNQVDVDVQEASCRQRKVAQGCDSIPGDLRALAGSCLSAAVFLNSWPREMLGHKFCRFDSRMTEAVQRVKHLASKRCRHARLRFAGISVTVQRESGAWDVHLLQPEGSIPFAERAQISVFLLRRGQCFRRYRYGDGLHAGMGISYDVIPAGYMSYIRGEFRDVVQVLELVPLFVECVYEWFVVLKIIKCRACKIWRKCFTALQIACSSLS